MNEIISVIRVEEEDRLAMLPRYFGAFMGNVENTIYSFMNETCEQYNGAFWDFYMLSNGGFYMVPNIDGPLDISIASNYFEGRMSAEAAGITVCLFAYSHLSFLLGAKNTAKQYHLLRDYALDHPEAGLILAAID